MTLTMKTKNQQVIRRKSEETRASVGDKAGKWGNTVTRRTWLHGLASDNLVLNDMTANVDGPDQVQCLI